MAVLQRIPRSKGLQELTDLLAVIRDPKKFESYIKQIDESTEAHLKAVADLNLGRSVIKAQEDIDKQKAALQRQREDFQRKVAADASMLSSKDEGFKERDKLLTDREAALKVAADALNAKGRMQASEVAMEKEQLAKERAAADRREKAAAKARDESNAAKKQYETKLAQIRAVAQ